MDENENLFDSLLEKTTEFVKSNIELAKLKAIDKITDVVSSFVSQIIVFIMVAIFFVFFSLGMALWIGDILNNPFYGFFVVAGFYAIIAVIIHFFLSKTIKRKISNYIIKQIFK